jgi:hypothetical protein
MPIELETARLRLVSFSPEHLLALIDGTGRFEERFGLGAADGLREFFVSADVSPAWLAQLRASSAADAWTHGFAVVHRESRSVIGSIGFKGPPDDAGMVEIAYGIVPGFQAQATRRKPPRRAWRSPWPTVGCASCGRTRSRPTMRRRRSSSSAGSPGPVRSRTRRTAPCGGGSAAGRLRPNSTGDRVPKPCTCGRRTTTLSVTASAARRKP